MGNKVKMFYMCIILPWHDISKMSIGKHLFRKWTIRKWTSIGWS